MEVQWLLNLGFGIAGAFGMWILTRITASVDKIEDHIKDMPHRYVTKDDYRHDIDDIKTMLNDIYRELRTKADK
jgi:hypothetical protein